MTPATHTPSRLGLAGVGLLALCLGGCIIAPPPPAPVAQHLPPPVIMAPSYAPPPGVVYVHPTYAMPGPGYGWRYHPRFGWGWHHPRGGWHRGWN